MWSGQPEGKRAFIAMTVAVGGTVDDALAALAHDDGAPTTMRLPDAPSAPMDTLVAGLRADTRAARATALAAALRDVLVAAEGMALR